MELESTAISNILFKALCHLATMLIFKQMYIKAISQPIDFDGRDYNPI
jgi:hypothetical protein